MGLPEVKRYDADGKLSPTGQWVTWDDHEAFSREVLEAFVAMRGDIPLHVGRGRWEVLQKISSRLSAGSKGIGAVISFVEQELAQTEKDLEKFQK